MHICHENNLFYLAIMANNVFGVITDLWRFATFSCQHNWIVKIPQHPIQMVHHTNSINNPACSRCT